MSQGRMLFVCTGNICRSPMAEYLFRQGPAAECGWAAGSAGVAAVSGLTASREAVQVLAERGVDLAPHRSRQLTPEMVDEASLVVVMTRAHQAQLGAVSPRAAERTVLLRTFDPEAGDPDIEDPIGSSLAVYRQVRDQIAAALPGVAGYARSLAKYEL